MTFRLLDELLQEDVGEVLEQDLVRQQAHHDGAEWDAGVESRVLTERTVVCTATRYLAQTQSHPIFLEPQQQKDRQRQLDVNYRACVGDYVSYVSTSCERVHWTADPTAAR